MTEQPAPQPQLAGSSAPPPLVDPGHQQLAILPASLVAGHMMTPQGQPFVATIRSGNATVTVVLPKDDAATWGRVFAEGSAAMSGLIVPGFTTPADLQASQ